jgi:hypothetical protein
MQPSRRSSLEMTVLVSRSVSARCRRSCSARPWAGAGAGAGVGQGRRCMWNQVAGEKRSAVQWPRMDNWSAEGAGGDGRQQAAAAQAPRRRASCSSAPAQLSACSAPSACWTVPPRQQPPAYWLLSALSGAAVHASSKSRCATRSSAAQHIRMAAGLTLSLPVLPVLPVLLPPRPAPVPVPAAAAMRMGMGRMLSWKSCCPF